MPAAPTRNRVVLVTGASSGIGRATAIAFARVGDRLVLAARREHELQVTLGACAAAAGRPIADVGRIVICDVADPAQVDALAESLRAAEGRLDVLVNNAGIGTGGISIDGSDASVEAIEHVLAVNLLGPARLASRLVALLRQSPRAAIVNVSSVAGVVATARSPIYAASKFGLTGFSEGLHYELHALGIHVATVQPGPVPTPGWPHADLVTGALRRRLLTTTPERIARTIVRAADGRTTWPMLPRTYRALQLLKVLAPPLHRALFRSSLVERAASRR